LPLKNYSYDTDEHPKRINFYSSTNFTDYEGEKIGDSSADVSRGITGDVLLFPNSGRINTNSAKGKIINI